MYDVHVHVLVRNHMYIDCTLYSTSVHVSLSLSLSFVYSRLLKYVILSGPEGLMPHLLSHVHVLIIGVHYIYICLYVLLWMGSGERYVRVSLLAQARLSASFCGTSRMCSSTGHRCRRLGCNLYDRFTTVANRTAAPEYVHCFPCSWQQTLS